MEASAYATRKLYVTLIRMTPAHVYVTCLMPQDNELCTLYMNTELDLERKGGVKYYNLSEYSLQGEPPAPCTHSRSHMSFLVLCT